MIAVVPCVFAMLIHVSHGLPKILALHGGGQSASSFQAMAGMQQLVNSLSSSYEFVFAQSPESGDVWIRDVPGGKSSTTTDPAWAATSVNYLNGVVQSQGPFEVIMGYSQGGAMTLVYLSQVATGTFQKAVIFCGYIPTLHEGLTNTINAQSPFGNIPALAFMATNDVIIAPALTADAAAKFTSPVCLTSTNAGHAPPTSSDTHYNGVVDWLQNVATTGGSCAAPKGGTAGAATDINAAFSLCGSLFCLLLSMQSI